jgi:5'-nucleotidase / UDP-sugar diphosphatase
MWRKGRLYRLAMITSMLAMPVHAQDTQGQKEITILFTTDLYGCFRDITCGREPPRADFANLVASIDKVREDLEAVGRSGPLVLNGGDNIGPHAFSRFLLSRGIEGGRRMATWMKRAGFELVALGNQDFYAVPSRLCAYLQAGKDAGLAFSAANLDCDSSENGPCAYFGLGPKRYRMFEREGLKIAVLSVLHERLADQAPPSHLVGIAVANPYARAAEITEAARKEGADLVILLSHLDHSETSPRHALKLARTVPDADLVIANAFASESGQRGIGVIRFSDGATPILGSDLFGEHLGRADLIVKRKGGRWRVSQLEARELDPARVEPDEELRRQLDAEHRAYCEQWDKPVGAGRLLSPMSASEFETYLLEILRQTTESELAFINRGLVNPRTVFPLEGEITRHDFFSALPHRNRIYTFKLDVVALTALCAGLANEKKANGDVRLLHRGLECGDPIKVNGRALESGESYSAVTIEYLADGMHGYFSEQSKKMKLYRPKGEEVAPVLGRLARNFLSGPRFSGAHPEPIDLAGNFPDLARKLRWAFQGTVNFNLADTRIENGPGYDESQLTRDPFIALKGELRGKIGASSSLHAFSVEAWLKYARSATNNEPFVESEDLTAVNLLYKLNVFRSWYPSWYVPSLYLEGHAETELTRPDERDYHHLELTGTTGARFTLFPTLEAKLGVGVRDEMFEEGSDPVYGFEVGYELVRTDLFTILDSPFQMESKFTAFFGDVGRSNTVKGQWVNRFYFALIGPIFFNVTHELFFYRFSSQEYGMASDLTFGLSYHARTALQMF